MIFPASGSAPCPSSTPQGRSWASDGGSETLGYFSVFLIPWFCKQGAGVIQGGKCGFGGPVWGVQCAVQTNCSVKLTLPPHRSDKHPRRKVQTLSITLIRWTVPMATPGGCLIRVPSVGLRNTSHPQTRGGGVVYPHYPQSCAVRRNMKSASTRDISMWVRRPAGI